MTIRAILNRRLRPVAMVHAIGFGCFFLSIPASWIWPPLIVFGIAGFCVAFGVIVYASFWRVLCPQCGYRLLTWVWPARGVTIDRRVRYCPSCGADFDREFD